MTRSLSPATLMPVETRSAKDLRSKIESTWGAQFQEMESLQKKYETQLEKQKETYTARMVEKQKEMAGKMDELRNASKEKEEGLVEERNKADMEAKKATSEAKRIANEMKRCISKMREAEKENAKSKEERESLMFSDMESKVALETQVEERAALKMQVEHLTHSLHESREKWKAVRAELEDTHRLAESARRERAFCRTIHENKIRQRLETALGRTADVVRRFRKENLLRTCLQAWYSDAREDFAYRVQHLRRQLSEREDAIAAIKSKDTSILVEKLRKKETAVEEMEIEIEEGWRLHYVRSYATADFLERMVETRILRRWIWSWRLGAVKGRPYDMQKAVRVTINFFDLRRRWRALWVSWQSWKTQRRAGWCAAKLCRSLSRPCAKIMRSSIAHWANVSQISTAIESERAVHETSQDEMLLSIVRAEKERDAILAKLSSRIEANTQTEEYDLADKQVKERLWDLEARNSMLEAKLEEAAGKCARREEQNLPERGAENSTTENDDKPCRVLEKSMGWTQSAHDNFLENKQVLLDSAEKREQERWTSMSLPIVRSSLIIDLDSTDWFLPYNRIRPRSPIRAIR